MKKLAVLNSFAMLFILSVALILFSSPAQAYVYDDFTGTVINTSLWNDNGPNTGVFYQTGNGYLNFSDTTGGKVDILSSHDPVSGPFFVSMQYSDFLATNSGTGSGTDSAVALWVGDANNMWAVSYSTKDSGSNAGFRANSIINGNQNHLSAKIESSVTSGSLGIGYNGSEVTFWYNDGSGWTELTSRALNFTSDPYFAIEGYDLSGTALSFLVYDVQLVPLPPTVLLLGSGLLGLAGWRLRKS